MRKIIKTIGALIVAPFFIVFLYLLAALIGGLIPSSVKSVNETSRQLEKPVYLTANALHADIAIPINSLSLQQFSFLREVGFPLDNPELEYLVIGWGAREFYTSTSQYSDIGIAKAWRALVGDASVMHVAPAGDLTKSESVIPIHMSEKGFARMLDFMLETFQKTQSQPILLPDTTFGYGDLFYEAKGEFNIFNPCNVWVSKAMKEAGVSNGIWTPTTYSLLLHHKLYN